MDLLSISSLFGLPSSDDKVRHLLRELGVTQVPSLNDGDTDVYVERKDLGLFLVFTDEAYFKKTDDPIGKGPVVLTNVTVYCEATPDFKAYQGPLPFGLHVTGDRQAALKALGQPEEEIDDLNIDRWTINGAWVFIKYNEDLKSMVDFSFQTPDA